VRKHEKSTCAQKQCPMQEFPQLYTLFVTSWVNFIECVYTFMYVLVYLYVLYVGSTDLNGILNDTH